MREVIFADDHQAERVLFQKTLSDMKIPVRLTMAEDGKHLLEIIFNSTYLPDLIFLDINMPFLNGIECLEEIRNNPKFDRTPVVMYTTSDSQNEIVETYDKGANLYVVKPLGYENHVNLLRKIFSLEWQKYFPRPDKEQYLLR